MSLAVKTRAVKRAKLTKICTEINIPNLEVIPVERRAELVTQLERLDSELSSLNEQVDIESWTKDENEEELKVSIDRCEQYNSNLDKALKYLKDSLIKPISIHGEGQTVQRLKLPEAPLPTYGNGSGETLDYFLTTFENVTDKYSLSSYEKFILMRKQLTDQPLVLINSLDISEQSYEEAKLLLQQAFGSDVIKKFDVIKRLVNLSLTSDDKIYEFVGEMRLVQNLFTSLDVNIQDILQYFTWNAMNTGLQSQLVNITNTNKPSIYQISNNIFKAIDRYKEVSDRAVKNSTAHVSVAPKHVTTYATNVEFKPNKRQFCSLCSSIDKKDHSHSIKDCVKYKSPELKRRRLEAIGGCIRCGYQNHKAYDCKFKFAKNCFHCKRDHMSYLCISKTSDKADQKFGKTERVLTNTIWSTAFNAHVGSEVIVPTFTCFIKQIKVRCLKDTGCQPNIIKAHIANSLNLPIIYKNYPLGINGFNISSEYSSDIVRVPLTIGDKCFEVVAITVPEIRTVLNIPGMGECVKRFLSKGYKLADDYLSEDSDCISNLDFMLGTKDPHVLVENQHVFGDGDDLSVYSDTAAGVLVFGDAKTILRNISYLPDCNIYDYYDNVVRPVLCNTIDCNDSNFDSDSKLFVQSNYDVLNENNEINNKELYRALDDMLQQSLNYDTKTFDEDSTDVNKDAINYVLNNCSRNEEGRLTLPLLWNKRVEHLLGTNFELAKSILFSTAKKYKNNPVKLAMMDDVFKQQLTDGIIERVENLEEFMKLNVFSFLSHMPVFRPDSSTTKVRMVFLSNLCQKIPDQVTMSHNQVISSGPCLNHKLSTAITNLRFGKYLITYDLRRAFLQLNLEEKDSNRLLFLWFENVCDGNFNLVAYRNLRLSFGLRASPTILMLAMFKILCIDTENDSERVKTFKLLLYALLYMDNGAYTGSLEDVTWAYNNLDSIFNPYCFNLQQYTTNVDYIQKEVDASNNEITADSVKLLGLKWQRSLDTLSAGQIDLNTKANTKRLILKSIASQFDLQNYQGPLLNRARIFLHRLQCDPKLGWDEKLSNDLSQQWSLIAEQANKSPPVSIDRYVGERGDDYNLIAFTDSSKDIYAVVLYIHNLTTGKVSFLSAKNRLVNKQLMIKSIPSLELHAVALGVEVLIDSKEELSGNTCVCPIRINQLILYTDSMITLHWINSYGYKLDKMTKQSVFVLNRLESITRLCRDNSIQFNFVDTGSNPADCMTRALSHKMLSKSCYVSGPDFLTNSNHVPIFEVTLPNPDARYHINSLTCDVNLAGSKTCDQETKQSSCIDDKRYSSFTKMVRVQANVLKFINKLVAACKKSGKLTRLSGYDPNANFYNEASGIIIRNDQRQHFPEIYNFFSNYSETITKDIPDLVLRLNLFIDTEGIIRVKAKMRGGFNYPILLSKTSTVTTLIIRDTHINLAHSGCYTLLSHLRKSYWIDSYFSTVKKIIKACVTCRRLNNRPIKLNQNEYRDVRMNPEPTPFQFIYFDHLGPFTVTCGKERKKCWLLIITCMWSRAVNLKICDDLSVKSFLKAFQIHVFEQGLPAKAFSDLGSQLTSGANAMEQYLGSEDFLEFFNENGIKPTKFCHYFKGNSSMGSLVEVCVKFTKKLIYGAIRNNILERSDMDFLVAQTIHMINKRPIAFQESLRENDNVEVPEAITPELLVKGRSLHTLNVIPALQNQDESDPDYLTQINSKDSLRKELAKLRKVQSNLIQVYNTEFIQNLICQSVDKKDRYKKATHNKPLVGDIVLVRDPLIKVYNLPLAIVTKVYENSLNEVTDVEIFKGKTGETIKRHVNSIVPLLRPDHVTTPKPTVNFQTEKVSKRPKRHAKEVAKLRIADSAHS